MAYTVTDITAAVVDDLGDPSFSSTRILRYLNRGQDVIFNTHQFKFCEKAVVGDLTIGEHTYDQQTDHQATIGGALIDNDTDQHVFILDEDSYMSHREFFRLYPNPDGNENGVPIHWTEFGDQVYFNCPVDDTYSFRQRYYRNATELTAGSDIPEVPRTFRDALEFYALYRAEKYRQNHDVAATYKQDFEDELENMVLRMTGNKVAFTTAKQTRVRVNGEY